MLKEMEKKALDVMKKEISTYFKGEGAEFCDLMIALFKKDNDLMKSSLRNLMY